MNERLPEKLASANLLPALYKTQHSHWWSVGMRAITHALLSQINLSNAAILEIGCGGGAFLDGLTERYPTHTVIGADLNPVALNHAKQDGKHIVLLSDLHQLPMPTEHFGTIIALDAFDQLGVNLSLALTEAERILQPDGLLLMRVSAYDWLRGPHDRAFGTGRRYNASELKQALMQANLNIVRFTYANSLLLLPAIIVRLAQQFGYGSVESQLEPSAPLNALFKRILLSEAKLLPYTSLPTGLSLYALAKKAPQTEKASF
jgi:ubiquinone/menaquinone biosynthesis C-methylase UbiE